MSENSSNDEDKDNQNNNINERENTNLTNGNDGLMEYLNSPESEEYFFEEITAAYPSNQINSDLEAVAASESLAVQCLEDLFNKGSITGSEMALYKKRFFLLSQLLEKSRENEFNLLQLSKKWTIQVEKETSLLDQANDFPDNSNTEVSKMRQSLLKFNNDHLAIEDRLETLNYKILSLDEEKKMLENELNRSPGLREKEIRKNLNDSMNELKKDILDLKAKQKEFIELSKVCEENIQSKTNEFSAIGDSINTLKFKLVENNSKINQYTKAIEKIRKDTSEQIEINRICDEQKNYLTKLKADLENNTMTKEELINRSKNDFNEMQTQYTNIQSKLDKVKKNMEDEKQKETDIQLDKVKLDLEIKHMVAEKQNLRDEINSKTKVKDKALKNLKEAILQLKSNQESLESLKVSHEKAETDLIFFPKPEIKFKDIIEMKKNEIEYRKRLFDLQNNYSEAEKGKLAQSVQEEERLLYDLSDSRIEVIELTRLAQIKADEREQKAKEYIQKTKRFNRVIEDLKEKHIVQLDYEKKKREIQLKLEDFAKLYNVIQQERNKCANLINTVTHKSSEMREKIRILNNEIEILRTNLIQKDKYVQKQRSKLKEIITTRDSLQMEISKKNILLTKQKEKRDEIQLEINRLNQLGNQAEEAMVYLRKQNDLALQNRNDRAIQLIERNEEVCILQEKFNVKEEIIRAGQKEIQIRIDEIDFMKQNIKELKRQIELIEKSSKNKIQLEKEVVNFKIQLEICRDRLSEFELKAENPDLETRTRKLNGDDPSPIDLQAKLEELHIKLAYKEEYFLEKELLLEAVTRLVNELQNKVFSEKMETVELAKCLNNYKFQMGLIIKKLKAKTAELTMNMSESLQLQQEVKNKESALKELHYNVENDTDLTPNSYKLPTKIKELMSYDVHQYQLTNGKLTTAQPRPNAYMPENENDLPIPRPYGAHAPFQPSEPGSNMRHIRKQKLKPIEI